MCIYMPLNPRYHRRSDVRSPTDETVASSTSSMSSPSSSMTSLRHSESARSRDYSFRSDTLAICDDSADNAEETLEPEGNESDEEN